MLSYSEILNEIAHLSDLITKLQSQRFINKNKLDQYYTSDETVHYIIKKLKPYLNFSSYTHIIDPAAGKGAFLSVIKPLLANSHKIKIEEMDIAPQQNTSADSTSDIKTMNFLNYKFDNDNLNKNQKVLVITNPPFGKNSSTLLKFFNHASHFATSIAFVMPMSFRKDSMKNRLSHKFDLATEFDLPRQSFIHNNKPYNVPCIFQLWNRLPDNTKRVIYNSQITNDKYETKFKNIFKFTRDKSKANVALRRVGHTAGTTSSLPHQANENSHYFLHVSGDQKKIKQFIDTCNKFIYQKNNTVGPRSITKTEFLINFDKYTSKK